MVERYQVVVIECYRTKNKAYTNRGNIATLNTMEKRESKQFSTRAGYVKNQIFFTIIYK